MRGLIWVFGLSLTVGCAGASPARRTVAAAPSVPDACARSYAVAFNDVTSATRALLEAAKTKNSLLTTQLKPIQDAIVSHLDPRRIDSVATCKTLAGELRVNVLDLRQALIELGSVPRKDGRGPLVPNATINAIMYSRVSDRLRQIIY